MRRPDPPHHFIAPPGEQLSNAELIAALCQLQGLDQPQILRLAAQLISRGSFDAAELLRLAERERVEPILRELARLALHVEPTHAHWRVVAEMFPRGAPLREPLLHWTRLAQPVLQDGRCNAASWELVA